MNNRKIGEIDGSDVLNGIIGGLGILMVIISICSVIF